VDDGYSGVNFQRPGFQGIMREAEAGNIAVLITKDLSRLGRNYLEVGMYTEIRFPQMGIRYIAVNDQVDTAYAQNDFSPIINFYTSGIPRKPVKRFVLLPGYVPNAAKGSGQGRPSATARTKTTARRSSRTRKLRRL
jgi:hypothetical protein